MCLINALSQYPLGVLGNMSYILYVPYHLFKLCNDLIFKIHMAPKISYKGLWTLEGPLITLTVQYLSYHHFSFMDFPKGAQRLVCIWDCPQMLFMPQP